MRTAAEYATRASEAYEKYMKLQERITKIEEDALKRCEGNKALMSHLLKTATDFSGYRELVDSREIQSKITHINAAMAQIADLA